MHYLHPLKSLAIISLSVPAAYAGCYTSGIGGNQAWARDNIHAICKVFDGFNGLGGTYNGLATIHHCWDDSTGNHYDFSITNRMSTPQWMDPGGCEYYLLKEIDCGQGGDSSYDFGTSSWRFM